MEVSNAALKALATGAGSNRLAAGARYALTMAGPGGMARPAAAQGSKRV
jgi:hypothetical protein